MIENYLNQFVGTLGVLYTKLHQYHWYVEGETFFTLHELFEDYYDEVDGYFDEFAERMLALELSPVSTLQEFLDNSWIKEHPYKEKMDHKAMVQSVKNDFTIIIGKLEQGIKLTDEQEDYVTNDMLIATKQNFEKHTWMLRAFLR
ncbi:MAG: DNA starvation/stationary phase protection protein [Erysipelothrix sp.]|nr:DNA starvation/stationary phase protection protein [Erysipelothrix sp.]